MNKIKVFILVLIVFLAVGCAEKKNVINPTEYYRIVTDLGYEIVDYTEDFDYSEATYVVQDNNFYVMYVKGKKRYDIRGLFLDECQNVYNKAKDGYKESTDGNEQWLSLEIDDGKNYYYVVYVNDTYVYVETDIFNKGKAKDLVEKIGY